MKNFLKNGGLVLFGLLTFAGTASAALPESVGTAFTALKTDGLALIDLAWDPAIAITVGFILIGLFKKGAGKAV